MLEDKKNYKNWKKGDTFALKIKNQDNKYGIKYLIFNLVEFDFFKEEKGKNDILFRVKILKEENISTSYEGLEKLEYIKTMFFSKHEACALLEEKPDYMNIIPDEYDLIYAYQICVYTTNRKCKIPENLIYIGNYNLTAPVDEYIPWTMHNLPYKYWDELVETLLEKYILLNKREGVIFDSQKALEYNQQELYMRKKAEHFLKDIQIHPEKYNYLCEDVKDDTLTYVGNDKDKD